MYTIRLIRLASMGYWSPLTASVVVRKYELQHCDSELVIYIMSSLSCDQVITLTFITIQSCKYKYCIDSSLRWPNHVLNISWLKSKTRNRVCGESYLGAADREAWATRLLQRIPCYMIHSYWYLLYFVQTDETFWIWKLFVKRVHLNFKV